MNRRMCRSLRSSVGCRIHRAPSGRWRPDLALGDAVALAFEDPDAGLAPVGRRLDLHAASSECLDHLGDDVAVAAQARRRMATSLSSSRTGSNGSPSYRRCRVVISRPSRSASGSQRLHAPEVGARVQRTARPWRRGAWRSLPTASIRACSTGEPRRCLPRPDVRLPWRGEPGRSRRRCSSARHQIGRSGLVRQLLVTLCQLAHESHPDHRRRHVEHRGQPSDRTELVEALGDGLDVAGWEATAGERTDLNGEQQPPGGCRTARTRPRAPGCRGRALPAVGSVDGGRLRRLPEFAQHEERDRRRAPAVAGTSRRSRTVGSTWLPVRTPARCSRSGTSRRS